MKKILVFGANGMLGHTVSEYFSKNGWDVKRISRKEFNINTENHNLLFDMLADYEFIINCAGIIKQRINEISNEEMLMVNSIFPRNLAKVGNIMNKKIINISTDCAYNGKKGNYNENDLFSAEDVYGISKIGGESTLSMNLRTSIVGEEKNGNHSLLEWARSKKGKEIDGYTNHYWNGVTTLYLAEIIKRIIDDNLYKVGTYHIHSLNTVSKYELLQIIDKVYKLDLEIAPVKAGSFCDRSMTSNHSLTSSVSTKNLETQLKEMREFFN